MLLELLWLLAAVIAIRLFRFPLLAAQAVLAGWIVVTDLISNGGGWSAVVTLFVGLVYLAVALAVDAGPGRPYGFWLHVGAGLLIGGGLLWFWHGGNIEWTLIAIASVVYVFFSQLVGRSSWAVLGAVGLLLAAVALRPRVDARAVGLLLRRQRRGRARGSLRSSSPASVSCWSRSASRSAAAA